MAGWVILGTVVAVLLAVASMAAALWRRKNPGFKAIVETATQEFAKHGIKIDEPPDPKSVIEDLKIQWNDHFHMRDQSWKTLTNSALLFVGIVGLEIYRGAPYLAMLAGYLALVLVSVMGFLVTEHHRYIQQAVKLPIIVRYELFLGLVPMLQDVITQPGGGKRISTSTFIVVGHAMLGILGLLMFATKAYAAVDTCRDKVECLWEWHAENLSDRKDKMDNPPAEAEPAAMP